jgi:hypothetical protein
MNVAITADRTSGGKEHFEVLDGLRGLGPAAHRADGCFSRLLPQSNRAGCFPKTGCQGFGQTFLAQLDFSRRSDGSLRHRSARYRGRCLGGRLLSLGCLAGLQVCDSLFSGGRDDLRPRESQLSVTLANAGRPGSIERLDSLRSYRRVSICDSSASVARYSLEASLTAGPFDPAAGRISG